MFAVTEACFDDYHRLFGIRYPFGDYHQAFVPEFNAGAMENPGCVTFRDRFVFRARATDGRARRPGRHRSRTRWRTSGSATWSPCAGGTTCGSTSRSRSTWPTACCAEATDVPAVDRVRHRPQGLGQRRRPAPVHPPGGRQRGGRRRSRRCRTSTASPTPRAPRCSSSSSRSSRRRRLLRRPAALLRRPRASATPSFADLIARLDRGRRGRPGRTGPSSGCGPPGWTPSTAEPARRPASAAGESSRRRRRRRARRPTAPMPSSRRPGRTAPSRAAPAIRLGTAAESLRAAAARRWSCPDAGDDTWAKIRFGRRGLAAVPGPLLPDPAGPTRVVLYNAVRDAVRDAELDPASRSTSSAPPCGEPDGRRGRVDAPLRPGLAGRPYAEPADRDRADGHRERHRPSDPAGAAPGSDRQLSPSGRDRDQRRRGRARSLAGRADLPPGSRSTRSSAGRSSSG